MQVYKFGGASVKDADGVRNIYNIVKSCNEPLVIIVSAMGKTTNLLEELWAAYSNRQSYKHLVAQLRNEHQKIMDNLIREPNEASLNFVTSFFDLLELELSKAPSQNTDADYDRIVSFGELFSTSIISAFFRVQGNPHMWLDARKILKTTNDYREGKVQWQATKERIQYNINFDRCPLYITQGFIASALNDEIITLGREGSDYTAAIFANAIGAGKMTIWKDVPGVMNADPRKYDEAELIEEMTYKEAVEMSYFGANVIHPKTLKPLENARIPLFVRSFIDPKKKGTLIHKLNSKTLPMPVIIKKENQALLTVMPKDFSFMQEENLTNIFKTFQKFRIKVNIMEKAALSFTACVDFQEKNFSSAVKVLSESFTVKYNIDLLLLTIRHYSVELITKLTENKEAFMEQYNRDTAWFVQKSN